MRSSHWHIDFTSGDIGLRFRQALPRKANRLMNSTRKALSEEGVLNCYCSLAQINAEKIYPAFREALSRH